ncbi:hypothetical protein [Vulcanococcus limneticus]|uniref:hypothetical protein n=1 Tax=Vulcanococcus limneticus TaxID=2170428 RepID=UPI00398BC8F4
MKAYAQFAAAWGVVAGLMLLVLWLDRPVIIRAAAVPDWPLTVEEAEIVCSEGEPVRAVIKGKEYALIGHERARLMAEGKDIPFLSHDQADLFKPNPIPQLAAAGVKAYLDGFRAAAVKACKAKS